LKDRYKPMLKITVDNSAISQDYSTILQYLLRAHREGIFDVAISSRFKLDKKNDSDNERKVYQEQIVAQLRVVPAVFRLGVDYETNEIGLLADDDVHQQLFCLFDIDPTTRGGQHSLYDVDHLYSHRVAKRDIFVTADGTTLRKRAVLKEVGINVTRPDTFVEATTQTLALSSADSIEFTSHLFLLLDQAQPAAMNHKLLKRLTNLREAQEAIKERRFTDNDELVIMRIATTFSRFKQYPLDVAIPMIRRQYHGMKRGYLSRYPNESLNKRNIVRGLRTLYDKE
jgi:hypothetical protein